MPDFERTCVCARCGREYVVTGKSANPGNETQVDVGFPCACGGTATAMIPGSVNRDLVRFEPRSE